MQNEERHELKQNDLQEFLGNFGDFWKRSGNTILIIITVAVVIVAGYRVYHTRQVARHENAWADLALTTSPNSFASLGETSSFPATRAMANLHGADLFLQESQDNRPPGPGEMTRAEKLDQARLMYQAVVDDQVHVAFKINAMLGLAAVAEGRKKFDESADWLKQAEQAAGATFPVQAQSARSSLAMLDRLKNPIPLATTPPPAGPVPPDPGANPLGGFMPLPPAPVAPALDDTTQDTGDAPAQQATEPDGGAAPAQ